MREERRLPVAGWIATVSDGAGGQSLIPTTTTTTTQRNLHVYVRRSRGDSPAADALHTDTSTKLVPPLLCNGRRYPRVPCDASAGPWRSFCYVENRVRYFRVVDVPARAVAPKPRNAFDFGSVIFSDSLVAFSKRFWRRDNGISVYRRYCWTRRNKRDPLAFIADCALRRGDHLQDAIRFRARDRPFRFLKVSSSFSNSNEIWTVNFYSVKRSPIVVED